MRHDTTVDALGRQKNEASNYPVQLLLDDFDATLDWLVGRSEKNAKTIQKKYLERIMQL